MPGREYPLSLQFFWEQLRFQSYVAFNLARFEGAQLLKSGQMIASRKGTPLWQGSGQLVPYNRDDAVELSARFSALRGVLGYFLAYDRRRPGPKDNPTGSLFAGHSPAITAIGASNDTISVDDMPNGFRVSIGDFVSAKMDDDTYSLHQFTETQLVSGGTISNVMIEPFIPEGLDVGTELVFYKPMATFALTVDGYEEPPNEELFAQGYRLRWIQVFKTDETT